MGFRIVEYLLGGAGWKVLEPWVWSWDEADVCCVCTEISKTFEGLGRTIARHPYLVITLSVVFTAIWGTVYFQFAEEDKDLEGLYTPFGAQSVKDREYFLSKYGEPPRHVSVKNLIKMECRTQDLIVQEISLVLEV